MLTIFNGSDGYPISQDDYYIRELASGYDEVIFNVDIRDPIYQYVREEAIVRDRDQNEYIIKQIDAGNSSAKVIAQINLDAWKSQLFMNYSNNSDTVVHTVSGVLPSGWTVQDYSGITKRRTIPTGDETTDYNVTALEVLEACTSVYEVRFRFDVRNKKVSIINPKNYLSSGAFATRDLNLKALNYKGKSDALITRLYAEGADGLTFADINDGKPYVENRTYVDKIIVGFWKDDRYTNKESLLEDAQAKVDELSRPEQSYNCDVLDLANTNPEMYGFEDFSLFEVVTLIDDAKEVRADYQVVERWTYPYYPVNNKVILSESTPSILSTIQTVITSINSPISGFQQMMQAAIANATSLITGNKGGYVVFHDSDDDGYPDEILIMNTPDISTATKVWRWNASGLGYSDHGYDPQPPYGYGLAMTIDGSIVANFITTGQLNAGLIKVGIIEDAEHKNYWNMQDGTFRLSSATTVGSANNPVASKESVDSAIGNYDTSLDQEVVFNKLTDNGLLEGIYMEDGKLYINATYVKSGVLNANLLTSGTIEDGEELNYWNLQTGEFKLSGNARVGNSTVASKANIADGISNYNTSLDQSAVFNKLTANGTIQGIYMENGQLYVNGEYIKANSIAANALTVDAVEKIQGTHDYLPYDLMTDINRFSYNNVPAPYYTTINGKKYITLDGTSLSSYNTNNICYFPSDFFGKPAISVKLTLRFSSDYTPSQNQWLLFFRYKDGNTTYRTVPLTIILNQGQTYPASDVEYSEVVTIGAVGGAHKSESNPEIGFVYQPNTIVYIADFEATSSENDYKSAAVTVTANGLSSTVMKGDIISSINQSAEQISINASKIDLTGDLDLHGEFTTDAGSATFQGYYSKYNAAKIRFYDNNDWDMGGIGPGISENVNQLVLGLHDPTNSVGGNVFMSGLYCSFPKTWVKSDFQCGQGNGTNTALFFSPTTFKNDVYNSSGSVVFVSDKRKKRNIKDLVIEKTKSFIMGLKPREYKFKKDISKSDRYHHGFIAQEVKEAMSEDWGVYVEDKEKDFIGLRYDELIADMVAVIQDQEKRIDALERRMNDLTNDQS